MYAPAQDDEITTLVRYADSQLAAIRASLLGLTEEQARSTPCRSALSPVGIVKHVTRVMSRTIEALSQADGAPVEVDFAAHAASFVLGPGETAVDVLERFDAVRPGYLEAFAGTDPEAGAIAPPAPWDGIDDERPVRRRFQLVHQLEELARHAGHADIIREQVDGVSVPQLVLTQAGVPANDYFTPYQPAPRTLGA
jgi:hypothetical protein